MQLILGREALEPTHVHWMNKCARQRATCVCGASGKVFCLHSKTCRCGHFKAEVTGPAHCGSCKFSHLSPCLYLRDLLPPSRLLLSSPSSQPHTFRPSKRGHSGKLSLNFQTVHFHEQRQENRLFSSCCYHPASSISAFLWARSQWLDLATLSQGPKPSSTTSSHQSSCNSSGRYDFS